MTSKPHDTYLQKTRAKLLSFSERTKSFKLIFSAYIHITKENHPLHKNTKDD